MSNKTKASALGGEAMPVSETIPAPEMASEPVATKPPQDTLYTPSDCTLAECELAYAPWSGLDHWRCERCQFCTFDPSAATARRPSLRETGN